MNISSASVFIRAAPSLSLTDFHSWLPVSDASGLLSIQIFCFPLLLSALSIRRCLKYHFSHILTWELNRLQLRDQDAAAAADTDGRPGDAMLPGMKCA